MGMGSSYIVGLATKTIEKGHDSSLSLSLCLSCESAKKDLPKFEAWSRFPSANPDGLFTCSCKS